VASTYDAKGSLNGSRVPTQTLKLLQSSLRDYRLLSPCSRHCAALRAGLITIAAPRLNIAFEPSGRPQSCHTDFEAPSPLKCLLFPQATKSDRAQLCRTCGAWNGGGLVSQRSRVALMSAAPTALGGSRFRQWSDRQRGLFFPQAVKRVYRLRKFAWDWRQAASGRRVVPARCRTRGELR
jgi:hypothetical protein